MDDDIPTEEFEMHDMFETPEDHYRDAALAAMSIAQRREFLEEYEAERRLHAAEQEQMLRERWSY